VSWPAGPAALGTSSVMGRCPDSWPCAEAFGFACLAPASLLSGDSAGVDVTTLLSSIWLFAFSEKSATPVLDQQKWQPGARR
jgi:hypothetical protein